MYIFGAKTVLDNNHICNVSTEILVTPSNLKSYNIVIVPLRLKKVNPPKQQSTFAVNIIFGNF